MTDVALGEMELRETERSVIATELVEIKLMDERRLGEKAESDVDVDMDCWS